jgi:ribosome-associated protein
VPKRAPRAEAPPPSLARARRAAAIADDKRAEHVVILDLRGLTLVTDFFVICTSTNRVQSRAIVDGVDEALGRGHGRPYDGDESAAWTLLDYGDVVVHVFSPEARAFYRLERLWADAAVVAP